MCSSTAHSCKTRACSLLEARLRYLHTHTRATRAQNRIILTLDLGLNVSTGADAVAAALSGEMARNWGVAATNGLIPVRSPSLKLVYYCRCHCRVVFWVPKVPRARARSGRKRIFKFHTADSLLKKGVFFGALIEGVVPRLTPLCRDRASHLPIHSERRSRETQHDDAQLGCRVLFSCFFCSDRLTNKPTNPSGCCVFALKDRFFFLLEQKVAKREKVFWHLSVGNCRQIFARGYYGARKVLCTGLTAGMRSPVSRFFI